MVKSTGLDSIDPLNNELASLPPSTPSKTLQSIFTIDSALCITPAMMPENKSALTHTRQGPQCAGPGLTATFERAQSSEKCRMAKRHRFTVEFKFEAVRLLDSGLRPASEAAIDPDIRRNQLYKWKAQMMRDGERSFPRSGHKPTQSEAVKSIPQITHTEIE